MKLNDHFDCLHDGHDDDDDYDNDDDELHNQGQYHQEYSIKKGMML